MRYVLGVDGGGSKVNCLAANEKGALLGCGHGGPVNTNYVLIQEAVDATCRAVNAALQTAGLKGEQVEVMVVSAPLNPAALEAVTGRCHLKRVVRAAEGETCRWTAKPWIDEHVGVTVDAGTGSLSRGWTQDGREAGAGGFGATLGDEGSGFWISLKAISAALQASDGRLEASRLPGHILTHFGISHLTEIPFRVSGGFITSAKMLEARETGAGEKVMIDSGQVIDRSTPSTCQNRVPPCEDSQGGLYFLRVSHPEPLTRAEIASLCPVVVEAARQGDPLAIQILLEAGRELGRLAAAVIRRLGLETEAFAIVPFGGVFKAGELILGSFRETCLAAAPRSTLVQPKFEPEVGAVLLALREIGAAVTEGVKRTLEQSSNRFPTCRR